jgi:hypothetical protein
MGRREVRMWPFVCLVVLLLCWTAVLPTDSLGDGGGFPKPTCNASLCNIDCHGATAGCGTSVTCKSGTGCDRCDCQNTSPTSTFCDCVTKGIEP